MAVIHDHLVCNAFPSTRQVEQLHHVNPAMKIIYVTCVFHGKVVFRTEIDSRLSTRTRPAGSQCLSINPTGQSAASFESRHENHIGRLCFSWYVLLHRDCISAWRLYTASWFTTPIHRPGRSINCIMRISPRKSYMPLVIFMVCPFAQRLKLDLALVHGQLVRHAFSSTRQVDQLHCVAPAMKLKYAACVFHGKVVFCTGIEFHHENHKYHFCFSW